MKRPGATCARSPIVGRDVRFQRSRSIGQRKHRVASESGADSMSVKHRFTPKAERSKVRSLPSPAVRPRSVLGLPERYCGSPAPGRSTRFSTPWAENCLKAGPYSSITQKPPAPSAASPSGSIERSPGVRRSLTSESATSSAESLSGSPM